MAGLLSRIRRGFGHGSGRGPGHGSRRSGATRRSASRPLAPDLRRAGWVLLGVSLPLVVGDWVVDVGSALARRPVEGVGVSGELKRVSREALVDRVREALDGDGFLTVDLGRVRSAVEEMPWIYRAVVRRRWPGSLDIHVTEQVPIARWSDRGYLNHAGELFVPPDARDWAAHESLPRLSGPPGSQHSLMEHYKRVQDSLQGMQLRLTGLGMDPRGSLTAELAGGAVLVLGREEVGPRLRRFERLYRERLAGRGGQLRRVDLRYSHGVAVAWSESPAPLPKDNRKSHNRTL